MLGHIQVGKKEASSRYVQLKLKACDEVGIGHKGFNFDETTVTQTELLGAANALREEEQVSGILLQLPLPTDRGLDVD